MRAIGAVRRYLVAGAITSLIAPAAFAFPQAASAQGSSPLGAIATRAPARIVAAVVDAGCTVRIASVDRGSSWAAPLDRIVNARLTDVSLRQALDSVAGLARVELSYSAELLPRDRRVCVAIDRVSIGAVLETLLSGTTLRPIVIGTTQIVLAPSRSSSGIDVASTARRASVLDRVVVTGTPDGASQRGSPFALDVIEGATLTKLGASSLGDALDMTVPGIWSWASSAGSVSARYGSIRGASSFGVSAPKIYLDGIEVANPLLVTQLDPSRVDRVEVIRGPQGAALYGADAISGVVNILTRHDGTATGAMSLQLSTSAGMAATSYAPSNAFVQEHTISLRGGSGKRTFGLGVNVGTVGAYVPGASERRVLADADLRVVRSRSVLTGTMRLSMQRADASTNLVLGGLTAALNATARPTAPNSPALFDGQGASAMAPDSGKYAPPPKETTRFAGDSAAGQEMSQYTVGGTATIMPTLRWTHTIIAGVDGYRLRGLSSAGLPTPAITASELTNAQGAADRGSLRLRTVGRFDVAEQTSLNLTFAAEQAILREVRDESGQPIVTRASGTAFGPPLRPQAGGGALKALSSTWAQNGGLLAQANLSYRDSWFFVAGARVERSTGIMANAQTELLPMLGAAYVRDVHGVVLKARTAYGTGIRPVHSLTRGTSWMGRTVVQASNSLQPESQSGVESGIDVLFGRALMVHVTRFDQRASGLIQPVAVTTMTPKAGGGYARSMSYLLENVGAITNRGWELQGSTQVSHLSLAGTLSFVDSRVGNVARGYRGDLRVGDRMLDVPARTASLSATWTASRWAMTSTFSRAEDWMGYDRLAIGRALSETEHDRDLNGAMLRNYWLRYAGVSRLRGSFSYRLVREVSMQLSGDNLLNVQRGAPDNATVTAGRTISFGLRTVF